MKKLLLILPFICLLILPIACGNKPKKEMTPQEYNRALTTSNTYRDIAMAKMKDGDVKGALENYDKAIEIFPDGAHLYQNRALARMSMQDYKGAIEDFEEVKKYRPELSNDLNKTIGNLKKKLEQQNKK